MISLYTTKKFRANNSTPGKTNSILYIYILIKNLGRITPRREQIAVFN